MHFELFLIIMTALAVVVFISLFFVEAGYGKFYDRKWGPAIGNRLGWVLMEAPVFLTMLVLCLVSDRKTDIVRLIFLLFFEIHYFQRTFIFPFLIRGDGRMALAIIFTGMVFNTANAFMQGGWIFHISPAEMYGMEWLKDPRFICGTVLFFTGMYVNMHSDSIIRHLREPGDNKHYLPTGGMFDYVTSANYFGELTEWAAFAILTWSLSGAVFALWTFANLAPRAFRIHRRYSVEFEGQWDPAKVKCLIPFIW